MDFFERRKKELGLSTNVGGSDDASSDFFEQRKIKLGLAPDPVAQQLRMDHADMLDPFKIQESLKSSFAIPAETATPLTKAQEESKASPLASPLVKLGIQSPNVKVNPALSTMDDVLNNPRRGYDDSLFSPSHKYVEDRLARERESASSNPVMRGINTALEPLSRVVYRLEANMPGLAAFQEGTGQALGVKTLGAPVTGPAAVNIPARIAGNIAGGLSNPSNIGQGLVTAPLQAGRGIAQAAANKAPVLGNKFAQRGIEGAVAGGIQGGVISGVRGETDAKDLATNIGLGIGLGAAGDMAIAAAGKGIGALVNRMRSNNVPDEVVKELLALPAPRERGRTNTAITDDVITTADTRTGSQPLGLPAPDMLPPTSARITQSSNPYRQQFESLIDAAKKMQEQDLFTPGREMEELESVWSQMAGRDGVSLDELIQRAYPTRPNRLSPDLVSRAKDNQAAREVAGVDLPVRSTSDRLTRPQGVLGESEAPSIRVGRAPDVSPRTIDQPQKINTQRATPDQEVDEIINAVNQPRVRDRVYSYLDDAEKAARERIKKRGTQLSSTPFDVWGDHAIIMAAKVGKGTIKATDFTEELVKEFGEQVRPHADRIFRRTKEVLRTQEQKASKAGQEADVFNNSGQGNADSFDSKISRQKGKKQTPFAERWEKMRTQFIDDIAPLEGLEKRVTGRVASAEDSLYKSARLFKGTPERAAQTVTDRLSPIVKSVEDAGYSSDDLGRYALAKHAQDVNNAGYKSGFTNAEIKDVLDKLSSTEMDAAQQALIKVNKDMMKELVDNGVVSKQLADVLDERWQNYIPLFREFDDDTVEFGGGLSKALANVSSPIKALKGSERAVVDPLENMVKNIFQTINSSERNKVATQLAKLATKDADGQFIRKLGPDEAVGRKNVVNVRIDGEGVKFEVEPEVYKAMLNLDQESSNMLINVLSKPASLLRAGATLTPEFSLRNPIRDVVQAYITSNSGFNPITDFGAGLIQSITKGNLYKQWIDNLGGYGNVISQDRDVHRQALEKVLKQPTSKKFVNIVNGKGLISVLRAISDTTESATKVGEFRAALRKGQTPQEAAYRSRDIMDFGRAGTSIRQANKVIAFLNANLQGKSKIIRSIKENPVGTTARAFASVTVPTIAIYAINHSLANETQKQTIAEAPDWQKDTFWLVSIPGTDQVARIPKPFDIAPIFANLPEKALDFVRENDKEAFDGFISRTGKDMALPAQLSGLLPFIEGMANYSFFREGSIIPQREQGLDYKDQYDPVRTTETAKALAAAADKLTGGKGAFKNFSSPRIMDNTIQGLTAGLGTYATSAIDTILKGVGAVNRPDAPEKRIEQRPLAKAFLVDPMQGGKSMEKFYEEKEKLQKQKSSASINERQFTGEGRLKQLNAVSDVMSKINKRIREIENSDLSSKQKRDEIDPLIKQRNKLAQDAVK